MEFSQVVAFWAVRTISTRSSRETGWSVKSLTE